MEAKPTPVILEETYRLSHRSYEVCGMVATLCTGLWLGARLLHGELSASWFLIALVIGLSAADLVSGIVHWAFDTWGDEDTPVLGKLAIRTFREHHEDPTAMLSHDFVETNGHNFTLALSLTSAGLWIVPARGASDGAQLLGLCLLMMAVFVSITSQIHKWAHMQRPPRLVAMLQRAHIFLSPTHHLVHHAAPHAQSYCITNGWLDGWLRATRAFDRAERLIQRCTGAIPRRGDRSG